MHYGGMRGMDGGLSKMDELDYELWHACAGPLASLPPVDSLVMYFPQGHIEQVVACTPDSASAADIRTASATFKLSAHLLCKIGKLELQADPQTDEVYAQMDLTPQYVGTVTKEMKEAPPATHQKNVKMFSKTLTASDTSTHGGFSVPRRSAEDCLPPLDYGMDPPCQELVAKDLHGQEWKFRHIYRGHPRRHLLTTGWSIFVSAKKLVAGDTVIFLRGENGQLRVGVRRASKQQPQARSTYFSSTNLHLGVLAAASHAVKEMLRFSVIYNPRTSPSEFVVPYHKYLRSLDNNFTVRSRFKMTLESEESSERRVSGTIVEISEADPQWPDSQWRSMKVEWDDSPASERHERVSPWEIDPFVPVSTLAPPQVAPRQKRRSPTLVKDLSPLGTSQSVPDSYQPNKQARILLATDPRNETSAEYEGDNDTESSRNTPWGMKHEPPPKAARPCWLSRPDMSTYVMPGGSYQFAPRMPSGPIFGGSLPVERMDMHRSGKSTSLDQASSSDVPSLYFRGVGSNLRTGGTFREPVCPQMVPSWLYNPKAADASAASSSRLAFERTHVPSTTLNNELAANPLLAKPLPYEVRDGAEMERAPAPVQQCKLFGFNLVDTPVPVSVPVPVPVPVAVPAPASVPAPLALAPSRCDVSQGSGPVLTTDVASTSVGHAVSRHTGESSQALVSPIRTGVKVYQAGKVGRTIDLKLCTSYINLRRVLAVLFNLQGLLDDLSKGWQLVYTDHENDVLLVGDDPWDEFCGQVKSLKIMCPADAKEHCLGKRLRSSCEEDYAV